MKKTITLMLSLIMVFALLGGCNQVKEKTEENGKPENLAEFIDNLSAEVHHLNTIGTLEVEYHNVGETIKKVEKKQHKYWIEYTGRAKIGVDASKIDICVGKDGVVQVSIPRAEIIEKDWDADADPRTYEEPESFWPWGRIELTPDEKGSAVRKGQEVMEQQILADNSLLVKARDNAKMIVKKKIDEMSVLSGTKYQVEFTENTSLKTDKTSK